jgi:DNA invertase Pin-like site-specific DNA recombinase
MLHLYRPRETDTLVGMRTAIYARVSTNDQTCENQLIELRRYCESRGWTPQEFVDQGCRVRRRAARRSTRF